MHKTKPRQSDSYLALSIDRALEMSGLRRSKLYQLVANGELIKIKVGRRTLIDYQSLVAFLERNRVEAQQG
jgi:excisionase family DNA binding protein